MKILWDFRLFSRGYASRGVGTYTRHLAEAVLSENTSDTIYVWAERKKLPSDMQKWPVKWIPYRPTSWKHDLYRIPYVILRYNIDLFHYWICLGPIHSVGMGIVHPCRVIGTVYDLGVALWSDIPFTASKRKTAYWKVQKVLIQQCEEVICISHATKNDLRKVIKRSRFNTDVVYVPLQIKQQESSEKREPYFITLGGSVHKNLKRTIKAFCSVRTKYENYKLVVLGEINKEVELPDDIPEFIRFEDMSSYTFHLQYAAGLIFCSLHEGLGLPPVEAMAYGCPLLLSDIPSLKEICGEHARFTDPFDINGIAKGMEELIVQQKPWIEKSLEGNLSYYKLSKNAGKRVITMYNRSK